LKDKNNQTSKYIIDQIQDEKPKEQKSNVWPLDREDQRAEEEK
jgi:hypothetical protein